MDDHPVHDRPTRRRGRSFARSARSLSLLMVAAALVGSLFLVERADTPTTGTDAELSAPRNVGDPSLASHQPRPPRATTVPEAIEAGEYAAEDVQLAIDRVNNRPNPGTPGQICQFLLETRARFIMRIDILIQRVPAAEPQLLQIRADTLAQLDAVLNQFSCPFS